MILWGELMRNFLLIPLCVAACAGGSQPGSAVYLYPGSKAEIIRDGHCTRHENLTDGAVGMAPPILAPLQEPRIDTDQNGRAVWRATECGE